MCKIKIIVPETLHNLVGKSFLFHVTIDTVLPISYMPCKYIFHRQKVNINEKKQKLKNGWTRQGDFTEKKNEDAHRTF